MNEKPNIYEYLSFRHYLQDYHSWCKLHNPTFSYRYFSQKAGFNSPSVYRQVASGQRNIAPDSLPRFIKPLNLSEREAHYFSLLVAFDRSKSTPERIGLFSELSLYHAHSPVKQLSTKEYAVYSTWYYAVIRELVSVVDFREDGSWIAARLGNAITPAKALLALNDLIEKGLLLRARDGRLKQADTLIQSSPDVSSLAIRQFNSSMIQKAIEAQDTVALEAREISGITFSCSHRVATEIKKRIQRFKQELLLMIGENADEAEDVYQCNFQMFPVSTPTGRSRKNA